MLRTGTCLEWDLGKICGTSEEDEQMMRFTNRDSVTACAGDPRRTVIGEKSVMEWRKFRSCAVMILTFACAALLVAACSSGVANVITVVVTSSSGGSSVTVIAGQVATFTATVSGTTTTTVNTWPCSYSYNPLPTATTPTPKAVTGTCTTGMKLNGGTIGSWVITTTNGSNVLTFTAPSLANFPSPAPTLTFTATADADTKKTATATINLDSGIRVSI